MNSHDNTKTLTLASLLALAAPALAGPTFRTPAVTREITLYVGPLPLAEDGELTLYTGDIPLTDSRSFTAHLGPNALQPSLRLATAFLGRSAGDRSHREFTVFDGCTPDYNQSGAVSVQDVFDFLAAYFNGLPTADFDGSGVVGVQDIFDFLTEYFGGCL